MKNFPFLMATDNLDAVFFDFDGVHVEIVQRRGWNSLFSGVHGSPSTKVEICNRLLASYNLCSTRTLFIGDASTDFHTARECKLWFVGVPFS